MNNKCTSHQKREHERTQPFKQFKVVPFGLNVELTYRCGIQRTQLRRVINANEELTHPQKMWAIQTSILKANSDCANMRPSDPRVRGAEFGSFTHRGWTETNGHDALGSREDLSKL